MWVPKSVVAWFHISKDTVDALREELAATRSELDSLKLQLNTSQNHFDWLRIRVNSLEMERVQLIEKAYGIKIPAPEITRTPTTNHSSINPMDFEDMGDDMAKQLGLPVFN